MYEPILTVHNLLAWAVLGTGLFVVVRALQVRTRWSNADTSWVRRLTLFVHLQLVAGLALWFVSPTVQQARQSMGDTMRNPALRRVVVEHPTLMVLAVIAATVSGVLVRKAQGSAAKARTALVGTVATLALASAVIPWEQLVARWTA